MIATLEGQLAQTAADSMIVTVGGVGIEVIAPYSTIEKLDTGRVFLYTRLVVREDSLTLYGFGTVGERELFDAALKVSGVGPKIAIAMLSTLTVDHIRSAVLNDRPEVISRVPGIGKKTAQKVVLELQDKLTQRLDALPPDPEDDTSGELIDALTALGYSIVEAQTAIQQLPPAAPADLEERLRLALQNLGG
ncbi:MAG: Holliday junction branch migration protein RuvA [Chloroflexi bacterium]|nr:Holliday junction branch migration protein RuvA [Chloroflexota bacterium]MCY4246293.1 Holliday junction branch migration protein RuvA [Chloroflexota bacterium]